MTLDPEFVENQKQKTLHKWKWKNPLLAGLLAFLHPAGMLYSSVPGALVCLAIWLAMVIYWKNRPSGTGIALACMFGIYAYLETRWRNAAVEKWKYGLPGTGNQNP
jgi:hypothetical protein